MRGLFLFHCVFITALGMVSVPTLAGPVNAKAIKKIAPKKPTNPGVPLPGVNPGGNPNDDKPLPPPQVVPPTGPVPVGPIGPTAQGGFMEFAVTPFANMEHGWHILDEGYWAKCVDGSGVVAAARMTIDAAINGEPTNGNGAYSGLIIRPDLEYLRAGATSGNCELTICLDANANPQQPASCTATQGVTLALDGEGYSGGDIGGGGYPGGGMGGGDPERATSFRGQVSYRASGRDIQIQTNSPGLSAWHPLFSFAAANKAFKDFQSPLVLDLNNDKKLGLTDVWEDKYIVHFDLRGEGKKIRTGWVSPEDAFLVFDRNDNGTIDDGTEMFGEYTGGYIPKLLLSPSFDNGFLALAFFDKNKDGVIDSKDEIFKRLLVWQDKNMDGMSQKDELKTMAQAGLKSFSLSYDSLEQNGAVKTVAGNEILYTSTYTTKTGEKRLVGDVWFKQRRYQVKKEKVAH